MKNISGFFLWIFTGIKSILTPDWITSISTLTLAIITIFLVFFASKTVGEWKEEKRFEAFMAYYEKLENQKEAAGEMSIIVNTLKNSKEEYRQNSEYFNIFKSALSKEHQNFVAICKTADRDFYIFFIDKSTNEAIKQTDQDKIKLNDLLREIQGLNNCKEVKYDEINEKIENLIKDTDKVILESAKSIKNKNAVKF